MDYKSNLLRALVASLAGIAILSSYSFASEYILTQEPPQEDQTYTGEFNPLNENAGSGDVQGEATFQISGGTFSASVDVTGVAPNTIQLQHIHTGARCPTPEDDTNNDGYIDAVEEAAVSGSILVPLDNDLAKQMPTDPDAQPDEPGASPAPTPSPSPSPSPTPGENVGDGNPMLQGYPESDENGRFSYEESADLNQMLANLRAADPNPDDSVTKLQEGEPLNLAERVVIIHGVPEGTELPPTVQSIDGLPAHQTLPVACAEIKSADEDQPQPSPSPAPAPAGN